MHCFQSHNTSTISRSSILPILTLVYMAASLQAFTVRRQPPVLVAPAAPTPYELKPLSDIDDQEGLRFELPIVVFYRANPLITPSAIPDPAATIKHAVAKALVFYYPFAGRIRATPGGKLAVECTGEGILFVEADANVAVDNFGDALPPPPHIMDELLHEVAGSGGVVDCPLLLLQVTRLSCGGFVLAIRINHAMADAFGMLFLVRCIVEIAGGAGGPAVPPVWERHLLSARSPPRVTQLHEEYRVEAAGESMAPPPPPAGDVEHRSFFFGPGELAALRNRLPPHLRRCSTFEMLAACLWRSRTAALAVSSDEQVRLFCVMNARTKFEPALPAGYYGNVLAFPAATTTAGKLLGNPLGYALEMVRKTKRVVTEEYMRSVADLMVLAGRPQLGLEGGFMVSDLTQVRLEGLDLGWAEVVYAGPANGGPGPVAGFSSFFIKFTNSKGEVGTMVPVCLPRGVMDRFAMEVERMTTEPAWQEVYEDNSSEISYDQGLSRL